MFGYYNYLQVWEYSSHLSLSQWNRSNQPSQSPTENSYVNIWICSMSTQIIQAYFHVVDLTGDLSGRPVAGRKTGPVQCICGIVSFMLCDQVEVKSKRFIILKEPKETQHWIEPGFYSLKDVNLYVLGCQCGSWSRTLWAPHGPAEGEHWYGSHTLRHTAQWWRTHLFCLEENPSKIFITYHILPIKVRASQC